MPALGIASPPRPLNDRQRRFVDLYLISLNATEAYKGAYNVGDKVAGAAGGRLMKNVKIAAAIAARMQERNKRTQIDQDYVLENAREVVERCMQRAPVMVRQERRLVQLQDDDGRDVWQFDAVGAMKALTLLAKHTGGFADRLKHEFPAGTYGVLASPAATEPDAWAQSAATHQTALLAHPPKATAPVS